MRLVSVLCFWLLAMSLQAQQVARYQLPEGELVTIAHTWEQQQLSRVDKDQRESSLEERRGIRLLAHIGTEQHPQGQDEWGLVVAQDLQRSGGRHQSFQSGDLTGLKLRYSWSGEELQTSSLDDHTKPSGLLESQTSFVEGFAKAESYFFAIPKLVGGRDFELNQAVDIEDAKLLGLFSGDSASIALVEQSVRWERNISRFEMVSKFKQLSGECQFEFELETDTGRPINFNQLCRVQVSKDGQDYFHLDRLSRAYSYSAEAITDIAPKPLAAMQPHGKIIQMHYSEPAEQLVLLTEQFENSQRWLSFWDIHQRKIVASHKVVADRLLLSDQGQFLYAIDDSIRGLTAWSLIDGQYKTFTQFSDTQEDFSANFSSAALVGIYPLLLNNSSEVEFWNPGYKQSQTLDLQQTNIQQIAVAGNQYLAALTASGEVGIHSLEVVHDGCNKDIHSAFCSRPSVDFYAADQTFNLPLSESLKQLDIEASDDYQFTQLSLHPSLTWLSYCLQVSDSRELCGVYNWQTQQHMAPHQLASEFVHFLSGQRVLTQHGVLPLGVQSHDQVPSVAAHDLSAPVAVAEQRSVVFSTELDGHLTTGDDWVKAVELDSAQPLAEIKRQVYPVSALLADEQSLVYAASEFNASQLFALQLDSLKLEKNSFPFRINDLAKSGEWVFIAGNKQNFLTNGQGQAIRLDFVINDFQLTEQQLIYARENRIYRHILATGERQLLYEFDSPVHEILLLESAQVSEANTEKPALVARLNRGEFALPHIDKSLQLPYNSSSLFTQALALGEDGQSFYVSSLKGFSQAFNSAIPSIQRFDAQGEPLAEMIPLWRTVNRMLAPGNGELWTASENGEIVIYDQHSGLIIERFAAHQGRINHLVKLGKDKLVTSSEDGQVKIWSLRWRHGDYQPATSGANYSAFIAPEFAKRNGKLLLTLIADRQGEAALFSADGYYWATPKALHNASFINGEQSFDYSQYDFWLNRPDRVLERLDVTGEHLALWQKMVSYRQDREPDRPQQIPRQQSLALAVQGPKNLLVERELKLSYQQESESDVTLHLLVNQVPVYGVHGKQLTQPSGELTVQMAAGLNRIKAYTENAQGQQSDTLVLSYQAPEAVKKPDLYLLAIGVSDYQRDVLDLDYARKDAEDISQLFTASQRFAKVHSKLLLDTGATRQAVVEAKSFLARAGADDMVLVFFAGHGFLDEQQNYFFGTSDIDPEAPAQAGLAYTSISQLVDGIAARNKLLLLDTCHSGEVVGSAVPSVAKLADNVVARGFKVNRKGSNKQSLALSQQQLQQAFIDLRASTGATVISAAGGQEYALEQAQISNGVFTASILRGLGELAADLDGDGQVTASELRSYTYQEVQRLTNGQQKPTTRQYNLDLDPVLY